MNIITAYTVAKLLKKKFDVVPKRYLFQYLSRVENLEQTVTDMERLGMVTVTGTGQRGDPRTGQPRDPKMVQLTDEGKQFVESFEQGVMSYAYLVPGELWTEFRDKAQAKGLNPSAALDRAMQQYIYSLDRNPF